MARAFCSGCMSWQTVDSAWRALWIVGDGDLLVTHPEHSCDLDFERPDTVFACGQGSAMVLVERYLQTGCFDRVPFTPTDPDCSAASHCHH